MLYGPGYWFAIDTPEGWTMDREQQDGAGLCVFYPKGSTWTDSVVVMYIDVSDKSNEEDSTVEKVMAYDKNRFLGEHRGMTVEEAPAIVTGKGSEARVRYFQPAQEQYGENFESVAYIDAPRVVVLIAMSSRTKSDFRENLVAFKELVSSYVYFGEAKIETTGR